MICELNCRDYFSTFLAKSDFGVRRWYEQKVEVRIEAATHHLGTKVEKSFGNHHTHLPFRQPLAWTNPFANSERHNQSGLVVPI